MITAFLLVADDRVVDRLRAFVGSVAGVCVVGHACLLAEARGALDALQPDLVITDLALADAETSVLMAEATRARRGRRPRVIAMAMVEDDPRVYEALCAGADGYFAPGRFSPSLPTLIRQALAGAASMSPHIARLVQAEFTPRDGFSQSVWDQQNPLNFDADERRLVALTGAGQLPFEIAKALRLETDEVGRMVRAIYKKLHLWHQADGLSLAA